jgi:hypothetical protein
MSPFAHDQPVDAVSRVDGNPLALEILAVPDAGSFLAEQSGGIRRRIARGAAGRDHLEAEALIISKHDRDDVAVPDLDLPGCQGGEPNRSPDGRRGVDVQPFSLEIALRNCGSERDCVNDGNGAYANLGQLLRLRGRACQYAAHGDC